jgi:hypothetical protein
MKRILIVCLILSGIIIACNKDKFQTKPQLTVKSTSGNIIPPNANFQVVLEYTDKEGDIDDTIIIKKERLNIRRAALTLRDSINLKVPEFPNKDRGEITLNLEYQNHLISAQPAPTQIGNPTLRESDTLRLKIYIRDKAKNKSDSVVIEPVIVIRL